MYKIGVISDTHGLLREDVLEYLRSSDIILHAGDINTPEIIERLQAIAPLYVVRGNNDKGKWAEALPQDLMFELDGNIFYMVHQKKDICKTLGKVDFIIYGHSHQYHYAEENEVIYLNPGSCGKRRFGLPITMAILTLEENKVSIEKINLTT